MFHLPFWGFKGMIEKELSAIKLINENDLQSCSLTNESRVLCAFSGGADSTALLTELYRLTRNGKISELAAAHFEHGIRGEESKKDLAFCRELCARFHIPFFSEEANVPAYAEKEGVSLETGARKLRYAFLYRIADENGYDAIALAHHEQDQAETLLFHLIRGAGLTGLTGMAPKNGILVRPLLRHSKRELLEYLSSLGQDYCTDSTNALLETDRNRIRLTVLPLLETMNPQVVMHLSETAEKLRRENEFLDSFAKKAYDRTLGRRSKIAEEQDVIKDRILLSLIRQQTRDYCENDVDKLRFLLTARSGQMVELTGGIQVRAEGDELCFLKKQVFVNLPAPLTMGKKLQLPSGQTLFMETVEKAVFPSTDSEAFVDGETLKGSLIVRAAEPGERFIPYGMHGHKLFSDFYIDKKVPISNRSGPVVFDDEKPVYVCGFTVDDRVKVTPKTRNIIHFIYSKGE